MSGPASQRTVTPANGAIHGAAVPQHAVLQRKCACGKGAGRDHDECDDCQGKAKLQPKLRIGTAGDAFEQEADRAADQVMGMRSSAADPSPLGSVSPLVQRRITDAPHSLTAAPAIVDTVLQSGGTPLDRASRDFFEPRFGHDFSQVRVHSGPTAARSADAVDAAAYTVGSHIVFGGSFVPGSSASRSLMAHELAHTIQQGGPIAAPVLARKPKTAVKQEMEVLKAPKSVDPSEAPWLVYQEATDKKPRKAMMPPGTRVETASGPLPETRTGDDGKPVRLTMRRVKVLALPAKTGDPDRILNKTGVVQDKFLAAVPSKEAPKQSAPTPPTRYSAAALEAKRTQVLTRYANVIEAAEAEARANYVKAQQAQTLGAIAVDRNQVNSYGGLLQLTAQVMGEPIKEEILVAHAKLAELSRAIEGNPLFQFFNGLITGVRENLDLKVFADNADTFAKFSALWNFNATLQGNFFFGAVEGVRKEIEGVIGLVKNWSEVKQQVIDLAKSLMSDQGANVAYKLGYSSGSEFGKKMTAVGGIKEVDKLATALGEVFGPILVEALLGLATAGAGAAIARAGGALKEVLLALVKARKVIPGKGAPDLPKPKPNLPDAPKKTPPAKRSDQLGPDKDAKDGPPDKTPTKHLSKGEIEELKVLLQTDDAIERVTDKGLVKRGYEFEIETTDHIYRRKGDGSWCRFTTETCGIQGPPELESKVKRQREFRDKAIGAGWAIEDHLGAFKFTRPSEFNFRGIDGWRKGDYSVAGVVRGAEVIQVKGLSSLTHINVINRFNQGIKGLMGDPWTSASVRVVAPKKRVLHMVFDQDTYEKLGIGQQDELRKIMKTAAGLTHKPPIEVRWYYYAHGSPFEITP